MGVFHLAATAPTPLRAATSGQPLPEPKALGSAEPRSPQKTIARPGRAGKVISPPDTDATTELVFFL